MTATVEPLVAHRYIAEAFGVTWEPELYAWEVTERSGLVVWVRPLLFTGAIIIGRRGLPTYDDRWCYTTPEHAIVAAQHWPGPYPGSEPVGWQKHPATGRRRP